MGVVIFGSSPSSQIGHSAPSHIPFTHIPEYCPWVEDLSIYLVHASSLLNFSLLP